MEGTGSGDRLQGSCQGLRAKQARFPHWKPVFGYAVFLVSKGSKINLMPYPCWSCGHAGLTGKGSRGWDEGTPTPQLLAVGAWGRRGGDGCE